MLILLDDNVSPFSKSQSLASLGLLKNLNRAEILQQFLATANVKLDYCIQNIVDTKDDDNSKKKGKKIKLFRNLINKLIIHIIVLYSN